MNRIQVICVFYKLSSFNELFFFELQVNKDPDQGCPTGDPRERSFNNKI